MTNHDEGGFTIVELLVVVTLFMVVSVGMYQVMFSVTSGGDTTEDVVRVSEEARAGMNRMVRDAREAQSLVSATSTSYRIQIDFDGDAIIEPSPSPNIYGEEDLTVSFDAAAKEITLNGETLMAGVDCIARDSNGVCTPPVFHYRSNRLEYDWDKNGVTTWQEIDAGPVHGATVGNNNGILDSTELPFINEIIYEFLVVSGDRSENFRSEVAMRNLR